MHNANHPILAVTHNTFFRKEFFIRSQQAKHKLILQR